MLFHQVPLQLSGPAAAPRWTPPGRPVVPHALPVHGAQWQSFQLDMNLGPKWGRAIRFLRLASVGMFMAQVQGFEYANGFTWPAGPSIWIYDYI